MRPATDRLLLDAGLDPVATERLVRAALAEDLGEGGDLTSQATVPADRTLSVRYVARGAGVVAGLPLVAACVDLIAGTELDVLVADGTPVDAGRALAAFDATARDVLALERTSLNLLCHLSGVATLTAAWVRAIEGTGAAIRDTRKTTPLLRAAEKYAVRCGGGTNHRAGLYDAVLIKDNHVAAAGGIAAALDGVAAAGLPAGTVVQIEVDDETQLREALDHGARDILLDNFSVERTQDAVRFVRAGYPGVRLESSGGLNLASARSYARTGVDFLAVGALTHSAASLDIGLDAEPVEDRSADVTDQVASAS